jgi:hypothetical protein
MKNFSPPSSGLKSKTRKKEQEAGGILLNFTELQAIDIAVIASNLQIRK